MASYIKARVEQARQAPDWHRVGTGLADGLLKESTVWLLDPGLRF